MICRDVTAAMELNSTTVKSEKEDSQSTETKFEFKVIQSLNFKCNQCVKKYTTEVGVKKHIARTHQILNPTGPDHFSSFIGERRVKVLKQTSSDELKQLTSAAVTQKINPEVPSPSNKGLSYKCSMCVTHFQSRDGVERHLRTFHGVKIAITADLYSYSFGFCSSRANSVFKTPLITTQPKKTSQPALSSEISENTRNPTDSTSNPSDSNVKPQQMVSDRNVKTHRKSSENTKQKPKPRKKPNVGFSKNISNMFSNGSIPMEKFSLWEKKKTENPKITLSTQSQTQSSVLPATAPPLAPTTESHTDSVKTRGENPPLAPTDDSNPDSPVSCHGWVDPFAYAGKRLSALPTGAKTASKAGVRRRKKTCGSRDCVPCTVIEDCQECRYCQNRNLK